MAIIKRNGTKEGFDSNKIRNAVEKAFLATGEKREDSALDDIVSSALSSLNLDDDISVEDVQDSVEESLMKFGYYQTAKAYIIYRNNRSSIRNVRNEIIALLSDDKIEPVLKEIQEEFPDAVYSLEILKEKFASFSKPDMKKSEKMESLIKAAVELIKPECAKWDMIASRLLYYSFSSKLKKEEEERLLSSFYEKIKYLSDEGLYGRYILSAYSKSEIEEASAFIDEKRNKLFTYSALDLLLKRYVIKTHNHTALESPQEMFLSIALHLAMNEKNNRIVWVRRFYDMLSYLRVTMATPTLSNARKPFHQLSSCFIDTVPDSLNGIYRSIDNFAKVSKFGGGMGLYFGKVRANGSAIRGFEGAAGGVIRWIRLVNDTAVAVDQLGVRSGAVAVYLDVWHKDLPEFLNLRTNNGDDRMKAHDVFPAICYPDLFWRLAEENIDSPWYMMCPHEIYTVKGYHLEDYFGPEWEKRYLECVSDVRISKRCRHNYKARRFCGMQSCLPFSWKL